MSRGPDYYLLRSRQPELLEALSGCPGLHIAPRALPNMLLCSALALFQLETTAAAASASGGGGSAVGAGAGPGAGVVSPATLRLVCALLLYPGVLAPILDKCGIKKGHVGVGSAAPVGAGAAGGAPPVPSRHCDWSVLLEHPLFASAYTEENDDLDRLLSIFDVRHAALWRAPEPLVWLFGAARVAARAFDDKAAYFSGVGAAATWNVWCGLPSAWMLCPRGFHCCSSGGPRSLSRACWWPPMLACCVMLLFAALQPWLITVLVTVWCCSLRSLCFHCSLPPLPPLVPSPCSLPLPPVAPFPPLAPPAPLPPLAPVFAGRGRGPDHGGVPVGASGGFLGHGPGPGAPRVLWGQRLPRSCHSGVDAAPACVLV